MVKVRDIMTMGVPYVDASATVLQACKIMAQNQASGAAVLQNGSPIGMMTERALLRRFVKLDRKPSEVKVIEVMGPLIKISPDASLKEAANKILEHSLTRLGVFERDKLLGWVTLTDIVRESSKPGLVASLLGQSQAASDKMLCPSCRSAIMEAVITGSGTLVRWSCPKCGHDRTQRIRSKAQLR